MDIEPVLDHMTVGMKHKLDDTVYQDVKRECKRASTKEYCAPPLINHVNVFMKRMSDDIYQKDKNERQLAYQKKYEACEEAYHHPQAGSSLIESPDRKRKLDDTAAKKERQLASQRKYYIAHKESKKTYQKTYQAEHQCPHGKRKSRCAACNGTVI
jgi:hypothetical protein